MTNNMKNTLSTLFLLVIAIASFATGQMGDKLIYKGKTLEMTSNPLEVYFKNNPSLRPKSPIIMTSLWRGYVATFELADKQIKVKDIEIMVKDSIKNPNRYIWSSVYEQVFKNSASAKLDWYTGLLVVPTGKMLQYVHMGYSSTFESYLLLEIDKGNLITEKNMTNKAYLKFKHKQFKAYQKTDEYKILKERMLKKGDSEKSIDDFLEKFIIDYTSKILTKKYLLWQ